MSYDAAMRGLRAVLIGVPPVVLLVLAILLALPFCATCGGQGEAVADLVKRCKRATELLGDDAHPARIGVACGQTETSGGNGNASWSFPYTGSRARGTVSYDAFKRGGVWTIDRATLEVGGETIDLVACAAPPRQPAAPTGTLSQTNADAAQATFSGKVIRSTHPTLAVGAECTGTLDRDRGSPSAHVVVTCGTDLYDARGAFKLDVLDPTRSDDDHLEYEDVGGTPACRLSAANGKGTLTVWSTTPAWELVVDL